MSVNRINPNFHYAIFRLLTAPGLDQDELITDLETLDLTVIELDSLIWDAEELVLSNALNSVNPKYITRTIMVKFRVPTFSYNYLRIIGEILWGYNLFNPTMIRNMETISIGGINLIYLEN